MSIPSLLKSQPLLKRLPPMTTPKHGGDLQRAKQRYPGSGPWLDLSAALNPQPWPVPEIPLSCFQQLPDGYEDLLNAARSYYRQPHLWPVNGSQQGIELLPGLFRQQQTRNRLSQRHNPITVGVPEEGYREHAWCWQKVGFQVFSYRADTPQALIDCAEQCDLLVVINPNNPTGQTFDRATLLACHQVLQRKDGWLVVDEAFMDAFSSDLQQRLGVADAACDSLIVLRSLGKFFGLAGIRSGFVLAGERLIEQLIIATGPWPVSGVTAYLTGQMLNDRVWQRKAQERLAFDNAQLLTLLQQALPQVKNWGHTPLFVSGCFTDSVEDVLVGEPIAQDDQALLLQALLAAEGIWIRVFTETGRIRLGLPAHDVDRDALRTALMCNLL